MKVFRQWVNMPVAKSTVSSIIVWPLLKILLTALNNFVLLHQLNWHLCNVRCLLCRTSLKFEVCVEACACDCTPHMMRILLFYYLFFSEKIFINQKWIVRSCQDLTRSAKNNSRLQFGSSLWDVFAISRQNVRKDQQRNLFLSKPADWRDSKTFF